MEKEKEQEQKNNSDISETNLKEMYLKWYDMERDKNREMKEMIKSISVILKYLYEHN